MEFEPLIFQGFAVTPIYLNDENLALDKKKNRQFCTIFELFKAGEIRKFRPIFRPYLE